MWIAFVTFILASGEPVTVSSKLAYPSEVVCMSNALLIASDQLYETPRGIKQIQIQCKEMR